MNDARKEARSRLRNEALARRSLTHQKELRTLSAEIVAQVLDTLAGTESKTVAGYWAVRGEPDILEALRELEARGHRVVLPVVVGDELVFRQPQSFALASNPPGAWGIPQPQGAMVAITEIEIFLVPGLAFDAQGGRLGYGKGYYDRALSQATPGASRLGIALSGQLISDIPAQPHDVAMHGLITEQGFHDCDDGRLI